MLTVIPSSSTPTAALLHEFVGCALAAGIVPDHVTWVDCPTLAGTATLWVDGVAAPICSAPSTTAAAAVKESATTGRRPRRSGNLAKGVLLVRAIDGSTSRPIPLTSASKTSAID